MASVDALSVRTVLGELLAAAESYQDVPLAALEQYGGTTHHTISDRTWQATICSVWDGLWGAIIRFRSMSVEHPPTEDMPHDCQAAGPSFMQGAWCDVGV